MVKLGQIISNGHTKVLTNNMLSIQNLSADPKHDVTQHLSRVGDDMIVDITQWTILKIEYYRDEDESTKYQSKFRLVDMVGMKAASFGYLILTTIHKANHENLRENYTDEFVGRSIYCAIMCSDILEVLLFCLLLDDSTIRQQRLNLNKASSISELFEKLVATC
ncbi:hypothetical protein HHI36_013914 [Cryptolaemus montrouzieri]|uniref:Uncharacterized protein n=1 Tax=Cryptolaemus montrouzieri TaxID=559131 RepID=A0ABD2N0W2_9CUCU